MEYRGDQNHSSHHRQDVTPMSMPANKRRAAAAIPAIAALAIVLGITPARGEEEFSLRAFCTTRGGAVLETGNPDIHICCYMHPHRCVAVDSHSGTSVRLEFPGNLVETSPKLALGQAD